MRICKWKKAGRILCVATVIALIVSVIMIPLQGVLAVQDGSELKDYKDAQNLTKGSYYALPSALDNYLTAGKTLDFDLNMEIADQVISYRLADADKNYTSTTFQLKDGNSGLSLTIASNGDGWYHYSIRLCSVPHAELEEGEEPYYATTQFRVMTTVPAGTLIANIQYGTDITSLPEAFTDDYDVVTLADLGFAGTDYKTSISSGRYTFNATSKTHSEIIKMGWDAKINSDVDWKLALDTYWNAACMVWFREEHIYFCPGWSGGFMDLFHTLDPITSGRHQLEFGRLRVVAGPNYGKDYVFFKLDGEIKADGYTDYYQAKGGYVAHNGGEITTPNNMVCFVDDGVAQQRFSGFAKPDEYVTDVDVINVGDIMKPATVIKNTANSTELGKLYPYKSTSKTKSTVARFVLKTGNDIENTYDGSNMVVDIGGNCGYCRSYIASGNHSSVMFAWEFPECTQEMGTKQYKFQSNSWYAFEQGRKRVTTGINKGKDWVYLKINGELVSGFYVAAGSRPQVGDNFYIEANQNFEIYGYHELSAQYYVDGELYLDQFAQKGFPAVKPADPVKEGQYFVGWFTAPTGGKLFDFKNTKLTDNIKLYARFTTQAVKATFNPKNGGASTVLTVGKNCLIPQPATPVYSDGKYEYVFAGWKNDTTGKIFDFESDTISANTTFTAQYKEKQYYASYYANGKLVKKVPFVLSNPTVKGKEPAVPTVANMTGTWEKHEIEGLTGGITVNAVYNGKKTSASTAIQLTTFAGKNVYLNTDVIHDYLSTEGFAAQTKFMREFKTAYPNFNYQDHQNITFKWSDSGKNSSYTVYFADNPDFKDAFIVTTTAKSLVNQVGIFTPGKTYYWYVAGNNTGKCSAVDSFKIINTPVRYITAGNVTNMRDEGGYMTKDGYKVKYGMVYRGASLDEYHSHVDDAARQVFNYLGMKSEIELRGGMEHTTTGWDENNTNVYNIAALILQSLPQTYDASIKAQYKKTFEAMADPNNYPFYFHCSAGADRTGTFGFLLNGLLGVPLENLREDYELTSLSEVGLRAADNFDGITSFDGLYELIMKDYAHGSDDLTVAIENFFKEFIGVDQATIDAIRDNMLDKNPIPNTKPYKITVDVEGKKTNYQAFPGIYFMPATPSVSGKLFKGFYSGNTKYNGYAKSDLNLTAKFEDIQYEPYDIISMKDLGVDETIVNHTNTVYNYEKTAASGGRVFQFIMEPIGDMKGGDGPQISVTNDWSVISYARIWLQSNTSAHLYYKGGVDTPPDKSLQYSFEPGKEYKIQFAVRVMKNKGYEGTKVFEVIINGESVLQYFDCKANLDDNMIYFHGGTGAVYLKNWPVYKTVKLYNGNKLYKTVKVERCDTLSSVKVADPSPKNGVPFAGWYTEKSGGKLWDDNADPVYNNMSLYARFANVKKITAVVGGEKLTYRVMVGDTLDGIPAPQKAGNVFAGWLVNGKPFTGKVTSNMTVTASFEPYSFDDYDVISLRDLGISGDQYFGDKLDENNVATFTYVKSATTGGRVFKAIYVPSNNMLNGPQVSFSQVWAENYLAKLYFTKYDQIYFYANSGVDAPPAATYDIALDGGKEYPFEVGVRVLNNKGYKGIKVFTIYINGKLVYEQFDNRMPLEGCEVFLQGMADTGYFRNVNVYNTVSFYDGDKLLSTKKVLRGSTVKSMGKLANKGDQLFMGWYTEMGQEWNFDVDSIYKDSVLKAKFQKRTYPVLLMVDGVLYKRLNAFAGESITVYDMPEKSGYEFDKWLAEDGSEYDSLAPVNGPITLVASFKNAAIPPDDTEKAENIITPVENEESKAIDAKFIWFGIIGLVVILAEIGLIIYKKRKDKC